MKGLALAVVGEESDPADWESSALADPLAELESSGLKTARLVIAPLGAGWTTELPTTWYRSGASPLEALRDAARAVEEGYFDAVSIFGEEPLRSGYGREERHRLMDIYGGTSIPQAYELLTRAFLKANGMGEEAFGRVARALFENYLCTWRAGCGSEPPAARWYGQVTALQRGVDCAHPVTDHRAAVVVASRAAAEPLREMGYPLAGLKGVGYERLEADGPGSVGLIAGFDHLAGAQRGAEAGAGVTLAALCADPSTALELYTCYPVIPAAFLLKAGIAGDAASLEEFLRSRPITLTGGMNLARAPWNLPALRGLVRVAGKVAAGAAGWGVVHGNGGVGYAQGVAILGAL